MKNVLVNLRRGPGDELYEYLRSEIEKAGFHVVKTNFEQDQMNLLLEQAQGCCAVVSGVERWGEEELEKVKSTVKLITRVGTGCDNICIPAATERGIAVMNTAGSNALAVAEGTLALMLSLCRNIAQADRNMQKGLWKNAALSVELSGKTVGIVGYGNIGRRLAHLLRGFDVRILAYDPYADFSGEQEVEPVLLDQLARESDFISVHIPATEETRGCFNKQFFQNMKRTAFFINASRGAVVNEEELCEALHTGLIAGAGLDVFEQEPLPEDSPLRGLDNVVLTPHMLSASRESAFNTMKRTANNISAFFKQDPEIRVLNPGYAEFTD